MIFSPQQISQDKWDLGKGQYRNIHACVCLFAFTQPQDKVKRLWLMLWNISASFNTPLQMVTSSNPKAESICSRNEIPGIFRHCVKFIQPRRHRVPLRGRQLLKVLPWVPRCLSVIEQERGMRKEKILHGGGIVCLGTDQLGWAGRKDAAHSHCSSWP